MRGQGGEVLSAGPSLQTKELARNANSGGKLITIITEFRILRRIKKAKSRITNLDLRRADFSMFRDQLGRIL